MRFSVLEEEISKIRHHIRHGESKKALELIAKIEKRELSDEDRDNLNLHKAEVLPSYGKHVEAMELIEKLIKKFQREKLSKKYITALSQKVWLLIGSSQLDNALNLIKKINELIKSLPNEKLDEFYMERYSVLLAKGAANYYKGNYKQHAKFAKKALKLAEKYNFEHGIGVALINLHESHRMFENKEIAYDYLEEAMRIFRKHKNQYRIAYIEHYYGHKYAQEMNYDKAIESYLKIMPFIKQSENAYQRIAILLHLSNPQ